MIPQINDYNGSSDALSGGAGTSAKRQTVHAFDFDGTLTSRDTFIELIRFAKGEKELWLCLLKLIHLLLAMKLGLYDNGKAKEAVFSYCFKGMTEEAFDDLCRRFASAGSRFLRSGGIDMIGKLQAEWNTRVLIVTASSDRWVAPFFKDMPGVTVIGTGIEVRDGVLTGRFSTRNCHGEEKVRRISELLPDRRTYKLVAYGDSSGDCAMLDFANEGYYRPFRKKNNR